MIRWVARVQTSRHIHDPAFGLGAFHRPASKYGIKLTASEIDPQILVHWRNANPDSRY